MLGKRALGHNSLCCFPSTADLPTNLKSSHEKCAGLLSSTLTSVILYAGWMASAKKHTNLSNLMGRDSHLTRKRSISHTSHACAWRASFTLVSRDTASLCHICVMQHLTCPTGKQKQNCKLRLFVPCRAKCLWSSTSCNGWKACLCWCNSNHWAC